MVALSLPLIVGSIVLSPTLVYIFAGEAYIEATLSVIILSVAIFFCLGAYFWGQAVLVPVGKEKVLFYGTMYSAIINVVLNILLIPFWKYNAAALTTLISECFVFIYCRRKCKEYIHLNNEYRVLWKSLIGCSGIVLSAFLFRYFDMPMILYCFVVFVVSVLSYAGLGYILKNTTVILIAKKSLNYVLHLKNI